jgi:hypothetical protein
MRHASSISLLLSFGSLVAATSIAAAEPTIASQTTATTAGEPTYAVGFRIGGYGFRREGDTSTNNWNECRMNGVGMFADRALRGPLFLEAGLDTYFSSGTPAATDLPIDRQSALISLAAGVRTNFMPWLRGYVQLGVGAELTRLSVPYGGTTIRDNKALPDAFIGVGGDLRIAHGTYLGASVRTHAMGNFNYDPAQLDMANPWVAPPPASKVFDASPSLSAQAQFYLRREL